MSRTWTIIGVGVDDYLAFARMLMNGGMHEGRRLMSAASVSEMTKDHLTLAQKAVSSLFPGFFDTRGWGYRGAYAAVE